MRNGIAFRRPPSAPLIRGTGCSFSASPAWPTPDVPNGGRALPPGTTRTGRTPDGRKKQVGLANEVLFAAADAPPEPTEPTLFPTPKAGRPDQATTFARGNPTLAAVAQRWPTPHGMSKDGRSNGPSGNELGRAVNRSLLPTPTSSDATGGPGRSVSTQGGDNLRSAVGGSLNPPWVEWLMGFAIGWTACARSATPSSRKSRKSSDGA